MYDASNVFGGGGAVAPTLSAAGRTSPPPDRGNDEPPRSAASLFGGDDYLVPNSLQGREGAQVEDMPDDLFGGGGSSGGGTSAFGATPAPTPPLPPAAFSNTSTVFGDSSGSADPASTFPVGSVPEGLFGGSASDNRTSSFEFSGNIQPPGVAEKMQEIHPLASGFGHRGDIPRGEIPFSSRTDAFGGPPPPAGADGFAGHVKAFASNEKTDNASSGELFGGTSPDVAGWEADHPTASQSTLGAPFEDTGFGSRAYPWSADGPLSTPVVTAQNAATGQRGNEASTSAGILSNPSRSASPPAGYLLSPPPSGGFGPPPSAQAPPADVSGPPPTSSSPPFNAGVQLRHEQPSSLGSGSPPLFSSGYPSARPFGEVQHNSVAFGAPSAARSEPRSRYNSWGSQNGEVPGARYPDISAAQGADAGRSRGWSSNSGAPSSARQSASPPTALFDAPPPGAFSGQPTPAHVSSDDQTNEWARATSGGSGGDVSDASLMFGDSTSNAEGNDVFGVGGNIFGRQSPPPPTLPPPGPLGQMKAFAEPGERRGTKDGDSKRSGGEWLDGMREESGFVAPQAPQAPPVAEPFGTDGNENDESVPWWQTGTENDAVFESNAGARGSSPPIDGPPVDVPSSTLAGAGESGVVPLAPATSPRAFSSPDGVLMPGAYEPHRANPETSLVSGAGERGAPPADTFGPPSVGITSGAEGDWQRSELAPTPGLLQSSPRLPTGHMEARGSAEESQEPGAFGAGAGGVSLEVNAEERARSPTFPAVKTSGGTERTASPGWEKTPSPPLELGVFGAPPGKLFGTVAPTTNASAAGEEETFNTGKRETGEWDVVFADRGKASESNKAKDAMDVFSTGTTRPPPGPSRREAIAKALEPATAALPTARSSFRANYTPTVVAVAETGLDVGARPSSPPRLFATRSSSWTERDVSKESKSDYSDIFVNTDSNSLSPPRTEGVQQESQARQGEQDGDDLNDSDDDNGDDDDENELGVASLSTATLPADHAVMASTASTSVVRGERGSRTYWQGKGTPPPFPSILEASNVSIEGDAVGGNNVAVAELHENASVALPGAVGSSSDGDGEVYKTDAQKPGPESSLSTPFGAWSADDRTHQSEREGFPYSDAARQSVGSPPVQAGSANRAAPDAHAVGIPVGTRDGSTAYPSTVSPADDDDGTAATAATVSSPAVTEMPVRVREGTERKEDGFRSWVQSEGMQSKGIQAEGSTASPPGKQPERKVDVDSALDGDDGWGDDWGLEDSDPGTLSKVDGDNGAEGRAGTMEVEGVPTPAVAADPRPKAVEILPAEDRRDGGDLFSSESNDGRENEGVSWGGGIMDDKIDSENEDGENEDSYRSDDSESSGSDTGNEASIAETTASDFFATPTCPEEDPESPKPMSRTGSRASFSSLSPLSGYTSGSRRERRDRRGVSEGPRWGGARASPTSGTSGSSTPYQLADVPPMFPLPGFPRTRRASAGGLPPPVPAHSSSVTGAVGGGPARSTWRSLSPSRVGDDRGWSISPVLRARAGSHPDEAAMHTSPSVKASPAGVAANAQTAAGAREHQPPRPPTGTQIVPPGEGELSEEVKSVARLGQAMGSISPGLPDKDRSSTSSSSESKQSSYPLPALAPARLSPDDVPSGLRAEKRDSSTDSSSADATPPVTRIPPVEFHDTSPNTAGGESAIPQVLVPTAEQGWAAGLSEAPPLTSNVHGEWTTSSNVFNDATAAGYEDEADSNNPEQAGEVVDGSVLPDTAGCAGDEGGAVRPSPLLAPISSDAFGQPLGESGVRGSPSPFVNTSSPLTRDRNGGREASLFGPDAGHDDDHDEPRDVAVSGAADLFATHAPTRAADELFPSESIEVDGGQIVKDNVEQGEGDHDDLFRQGPPPETLVAPPPSLPNPWGSSPIKQPLPEPKRWPTKPGTGFDRPLTPLSKESPTLLAAGSPSKETGAVLAAFCDPASTSDKSHPVHHVTFRDEFGGDDGRAFQASPPPTSFMKPARASTAGSRNRWQDHDAASSSIGKAGADGGNAEPGTSSPLNVASKPSTFTATKPAPFRYGSAGGFVAGHGRGAGGKGWGSGGPGPATTSRDRSERDPDVKPAGVIAVFGFGGRLLCMHPRPKLRLAPAPGVVPSPDDGHPLRKGPVKIWSLKDLAGPEVVVSDSEEFPGPASDAPLEKVKKYVQTKADGYEGGSGDEGRRLLWSIAGLALRFKGRLTSDAGAADPSTPEAAIVKLLKAGYARQKAAGVGRDATGAPPSVRSIPSATTPAWRPDGGMRDQALAFPRGETGSVPGAGKLMRPGGVGHGGVSRESGGGGGDMTSPGSAFPGAGAARLAAPAMAKDVGPFGTGRGGFGGVGGFGSGVAGASPALQGGGMSTAEQREGETAAGMQEEVEALLVDGKKEEAVDASIRAGLWGLALLIAAQCPIPPPTEGGEADAPPQPPYQRVVRLYANAFLHAGTPLHTMALAFSGQAGAAIKHGGKSLGGTRAAGGVGGDASKGQGGFEDSWMATAAAIISNKVPGWIDQLTGLADRLFESDNVPAAHALFLAAGMQVEFPTTKGARLVLPGVDHTKPAHRALRTREATDAVHVLEVLEAASKANQGRNSAVQGHKLRLAMVLADLGFLEKALLYVRSAQAEVAAIGSRSRGGMEQRSPYSPQFVAALIEFEDRLCAAQGVESAGPNGRDGLKKERTAGSAAAGAGGWLLNRVTSLVKTSATPGPIPMNARPHSIPRPSIPGERASRMMSHPTSGSSTGLSEPQALGPTQEHAPRSPTQSPLQRYPPVPNNARLGQGNALGVPPAGGAVWSAGVPGVAQGPSPFGQSQGPRPLGVQAVRPPMPGVARERAGGTINEAFTSRGDPVNMRKAFGSDSPAESAASNASERSKSPMHDVSPGAGAAIVAKRLLSRGGDGGEMTSGIGASRVSSEPALNAKRWDESVTPPSDVGDVGPGAGEQNAGPRTADASPVKSSASEGDMKAGSAEQAPKSEPKKNSQDKQIQRRASVGGAAVAAKPGRLAKMMSKWLYPDAKHADVGSEMEAYYDAKAKRWVFPGESAEEVVAAAPSAPPTASELSGPPGSAGPGPTGAVQPNPGLDANDPLAALMAPPQVSIGGPRRHTGSPGVGGGPPSGGLNWAGTGAPPMSRRSIAGGAIRPPFSAEHFAAFAPKAPSSVAAGTSGDSGSAAGSPPPSQG